MNQPATFTRKRKAAIAFNVLLASLLAPAAGVLCAYLAFRPDLRIRWDFTEKQEFTLSDRTEKILEDLPGKVEIYACFRPLDFNSSGMLVPGLSQVMTLIAQHTSDLLREYELEASGQLKVQIYDPFVTGHLARIEEFSQRIGEPAQNLVQVLYGSRSRILRLNDLADFDDGPEATEARRRPRLYGFRNEEAISAAVLAVTEEEPIQVRFVTGHGERSPFVQGTDAAGYVGLGSFVESLRAQNFETGLVDLSQEEGALIESGVDILAITSPTSEIPEPEVQKIRQFLEAGGKIFVTLDPDSSRSLDFALLDQSLGLLRSPLTVCHSLGNLEWQRNASILDQVAYSPNSPVVKPLRDRGIRTRWFEVCSFDIIGRREQDDLRLTPLVWSSVESWRDERPSGNAGNLEFDPASEVREAHSLAFSAELPSGARAVVFGDSHFLDHVHMQQAPGNRDLGLNAFEWLAEREQLISIAPRPYDELLVDLTAAEYKTILFYTMGAVPGLALLLALVVFWNRRH